MDLARIFVAHAPEPLRPAVAASPDLEARLAALVDSAQVAWPTVTLDAGLFVAHLAERLPEGAPAEALSRLASDDLYLACACSRGDGDAIRIFEATYRDAIRAVIGRGAPEAVDDVAQRVMENLLAGPSPAIGTFGGRSSLRSWLRVVATRALYAHAKKERRHDGDDVDAMVDRIQTDQDDPELERLKVTYRAEFKRGFARAFAKLSVRERNLLRHEHLDGLGVAEIAELYGVHRATIARWRADARTTLLNETRRHFREEVAVGADDFDSILRLIDSELEVSLTRLLRSDQGKK